MADGWRKLYRKAKNNPILRDANAWQMFWWILLNIDRETGIYTTGRYMLAEALNMKPPTVQKVLLRLQNVYKVLSLERAVGPWGWVVGKTVEKRSSRPSQEQAKGYTEKRENKKPRCAERNEGYALFTHLTQAAESGRFGGLQALQ